MPVIGTSQYNVDKLLNIIRKNGFMGSNLLQCDTLLLLVAVTLGRQTPPLPLDQNAQ